MSKFTRNIIFFLATRLGWLLILLLGKLTRIVVLNQNYWNQMEQGGKGFLVLLWHGRMLLPIYHHRWQKVVAMVSQHGDGEMIAQIVHRLGYQTVRGSSTRGGQQALRAMVRELRQGKIGTMMPDGPRGPRHQFKTGAIYIAQLAQVPLIPMTFSSNKIIRFKSWDRFTIMKPFSKSVVVYGEPVAVPPRLSEEEMEIFRQDMEARMIKLENEADEYFR